jgi:hypothetical protein
MEALMQIVDIATKVTTHTDDDTPPELAGKDMARRYYGYLQGELAELPGGNKRLAAGIAVLVVERIGKHQIRDWRDNHDALNQIRGEIDDILFDAMKAAGISLPLEVQDRVIDRCVEIAIANQDVA